uniref:Retrovirus-related Pol polyprotein from transposon TNT 1-94 n=1 Tax=Tanacetum cinerariifolium TaxID=118510 RepID=A0A6L2MF33_TANCI|nr:retrovirus-related Pol polyprotein from transposon TNT 1-94 [Tanacetum cinerariifolium]
MHNNIMAAGSRDCPSMLATGRYAQWRSRSSCTYKDDSLAVPKHTTVETLLNMTPENKAYYQSEKEAIYLILTGIEDEIYSTVDTCKKTQEMWEAIKRKPKRVKDSVYHREKMLLCKQAEKGVPLQAEQSDWLADTDEEIYEQELKAHYSYMAKIQENDQNDVECDDERVVLANLIANLKLDVDENKKIQKQLKKTNTTLAQELEECKSILVETSRTLGELIPDREETLALERGSRSKLNKDLVRPYDNTKLNSLYENFKPPTLEYEIQLAHANEIRKKMWPKSFVKYKPNIFKNINFLPVSKSISKIRQAYNVMINNINHFKEIVDQAWVKHTKDHFRAPTAQDMDILIKTCFMPLALKTQNYSFIFVHEFKQEMHANLKYVESFEKEIDELESDKAEFSNMYDMILQECMSNDVMCIYLHFLSDLDAHAELQCLYLHKVKECDCLVQKLSKQTKSISKEVYTELLRRFAKIEKHFISLELTLQQCQEQLKNDTVCNEQASNVFRKEREQYFKSQDLKAQLQDKNIAISELKKLIDKCKGKSVETKFDKPFVVRQPNAQRIPKPSNLPQTARQAVRNKNALKPSMYLIDTRTTQSRAPQLPQTSRNTNPRVSTSTGVNHKTNVSRPQHRSTQIKDKVVPNNSEVKHTKTKVEDHPRIPSISNKKKSVTVCNDILNSRMLNVNAVFATCGKCLADSDHFACVTKMLNDVNARTKKPNAVPISTRRPKGHANKSVVTPPKKKFASKSTTQKPKSYYRMLYEKTSKAWKWWIEQQYPSGYKWVPKTKMKWVPKVRNENVQKRVSFAIDRNITINMVYYVEGLNHNLFSVGQFFDADLEVAFRKSTCFVRDLQGNDLLTDKIKEKGDLCILVGYSTQSKGYHVYNKRTCLIDESIHIRFDEIKEMSETSIVNDTSGHVPQRHKASDYDNSDPVS